MASHATRIAGSILDLQESGEQYNPTDKLVVTIRKALSSKIFTALAGIALWLLVKFIFEGVK